MRKPVRFPVIELVVPALLFALTTPLKSRADNENDHWWSGFAPYPTGQGMDIPYGSYWYKILTMTEYKGDLIVGGYFQSTGVVDTNFIASWNGTTWRSLGAGFDERVYALVVYDGSLIAAGAFNYSGDVPLGNIARWDGSSWSGLGAGVTGWYGVYGLAVFETQLIAVGSFSEMDGTPRTNLIAAWDGTSWNEVGGGLVGQNNYHAQAIALWNDSVVVTGTFYGPSVGVARWNGTTWSALGPGIWGYPYAIASYGSELLVGGAGLSSEEVQLGGLARWDGESWQPFLGGSNNVVNGLGTYGADLIATGALPGWSNIVRWNGASWDSLGSGLSGGGQMGDLVSVYQGSLYVGGSFTIAGGHASSLIARWDDQIASLVSDEVHTPQTTPIRAYPAFPNPFVSETSVSYLLDRGREVRMGVYDITGRSIARLVEAYESGGQHRVTWNGRDASGHVAPSGSYVIRTEAGGVAAQVHVLRVR